VQPPSCSATWPSTVYYIGGIVEQAIGKAAPWYVGAVMLFAYAVRGVYIESCAMFVRSGVYRIVKEAMGGTLAKVAVSALMFDYVLTGPISGVSAGQYIVGLTNELLAVVHCAVHDRAGLGLGRDRGRDHALLLAPEHLGIEESSDKAMKIMGITTVMLVVMTIWCGSNARDARRDAAAVRAALQRRCARVARRQRMGEEDRRVRRAHRLWPLDPRDERRGIARSDQPEIAHPKVPNLVRAGFIIFLYSVLLTGLFTFFAALIIPDEVRMSMYRDNLIGGLAMHVVGPVSVRLALRAFVVIVGFLILAGAVNTAIIGSNGVLNRVAEDGVLADWFRVPHAKYGTTYRIVDLVVVLQISRSSRAAATSTCSARPTRSGVVWSFVFNSLSMVILRFKDRRPRQWRVPINLRLGKFELPIGLMLIFVVLLATALVNLLTKKAATTWGLAFTVLLFVVFSISERFGRGRGSLQHLEKFNVRYVPEPEPGVIGFRPGGKVVPVRDPHNLVHLDRALEEAESEDTDVAVPTVKVERDLVATGTNPNFTPDEQSIFTAVVDMAERHGKTVVPLVVTSNDAFFRDRAHGARAGRARGDLRPIGASQPGHPGRGFRVALGSRRAGSRA
jgi:amino acid transporter